MAHIHHADTSLFSSADDIRRRLLYRSGEYEAISFGSSHKTHLSQLSSPREGAGGYVEICRRAFGKSPPAPSAKKIKRGDLVAANVRLHRARRWPLQNLKFLFLVAAGVSPRGQAIGHPLSFQPPASE